MTNLFFILSEFCVALHLCPGQIELNAQESVNTTGGDNQVAKGSASYFFGQMVYTIVPGTNGFVMQGIQQPYAVPYDLYRTNKK